MNRRRYPPGLKRALDLSLSIMLLPFTVPLMAVSALAVRVTLGNPVLFRQERLGMAGRCFNFVKFRTMRDTTDANGKLLLDADRLTRLGRFLRQTSLDELPQLWNVFRGDMSLVGPRPLLPQYLDRYTAEQRRRHECRPGITGWAQVRGRNALSWERKFELDVWYVDHRSFWLDLTILLATLGAIVRRRDITFGSHATAPEFMGRNDGAPSTRGRGLDQ